MTGTTLPPDRNRSDRGQMLLIAGFGLAVMLVALALVLNTAIFTENIATRSSDVVGAKDAVQHADAAQNAGTGIVQYANYHNNSSYADAHARVNESIEDWSESASRQQAVWGTVADVNVSRTSNGTRIYQYADREFTNDDGDDDWELIDGAPGIRNFTVSIDVSTLENRTVGNVTDVFEVSIHEDGGAGPDQRVWIYRTSPTDVVITADYDYDGNGEASCTVDAGADGRANVSLTDGTVDGKPCPPISYKNFWAEYQNIDVGFYDAIVGGETTAVGEYELVANHTMATVDDDHFDDSGYPDKTYATYSATMTVTYRNTRLLYVTQVRVAPGEPHA